jgi:ppGpp synthetase/RelA/SpoT-type nucleotidyltranferase
MMDRIRKVKNRLKVPDLNIKTEIQDIAGLNIFKECKEVNL